MRTVNDSVSTVNAAAAAIVSAESRFQPAAVQKKRWGSCLSLYWCFGSQKNSKRIGHAVLVPEPVVPGAAIPVSENVSIQTSILVPFIAPPSSPASFLQSDPPSATHSPAGLLSFTYLSANAYSHGGSASMFAIGPYAHETQLVTPPAFSAVTTEPSTAPFTPPPESVQFTTPSSPEVPFAQLLTSSLERAHRNSGGTNQKFGFSRYDFQSYLQNSYSPGGNIISPSSAMSYSGASSPFPDKRPVFELRIGEAPKILAFEHFTSRRWGSRLGSGSLTPVGGSRLCSGTVTPDGVGLGSRLGSGALTPDALGPASRDPVLLENQISEVASLANSENEPATVEIVVDHRVSFELSGEDVARYLESKSVASSRSFSEYNQEPMMEGERERDGVSTVLEKDGELRTIETTNQIAGKIPGDVEEENCNQKHGSSTLSSVKEFNFDNSKGETADTPTIRSEWWANEKVAGKDDKQGANWTFFPLLQPEVS